uniref:Uncharacterized protein n=1 Tax=Panagrolaimus sp. JU765 TaxID=591449 RepID=A0AC34Q753_9BILA
MCFEDGCEVHMFRFNDGNNYVNFSILNDQRLNGGCKVVSDKVKRPILSISQGLRFFRFEKMDQVLQRRLYCISFPVQKKRLWNCSKSCANLGIKPTTLLLSKFYEEEEYFLSRRTFVDFKIDGPRNAIVCARTNQVKLENIVLNLVGTIDGNCFGYIPEDQITEMNKFIEFNHCEVIFKMGIQERLPRVFNENVKIIEFTYDEEEPTKDNYDHYNFDIVLQQLPNIEEISFSEFEMFKLFGKIDRDFGPTLSEMSFYFGANDENYYYLAELMRKQSSKCEFEVAVDSNYPSTLANHLIHLQPYFEEVIVPKRVNLTFKFDGEEYYFVLRNFLGVADNLIPAAQFGQFQQQQYLQSIAQYQPFNP